MELTQQEIEWIKAKYAEEQQMILAISKDKRIQEAREAVAERYKAQLDLLAQEEKFEERKALVERMVLEADEAERQII